MARLELAPRTSRSAPLDATRSLAEMLAAPRVREMVREPASAALAAQEWAESGDGPDSDAVRRRSG